MTKRVVEMAHACHVDVEGEIGHVGANAGSVESRRDNTLFTEPESAAEFLDQTGVDALAVAIGTAHGVYKEARGMVGSLEDLRAGKAALEEAKAQLKAGGVPFDPNIPVGIMVEIPSIAVLADEAARECDFASVGTNDLCQYLFAADRMNPLTAEYYQSFSPAMFRVLSVVFNAFHRAGKPVSVCGEMAGDPEAAPVLLGLGLRKFSMNASAIPTVKRALRNITLADAETLARAVCAAGTQVEVRELIHSAL